MLALLLLALPAQGLEPPQPLPTVLEQLDQQVQQLAGKLSPHLISARIPVTDSKLSPSEFAVSGLILDGRGFLVTPAPPRGVEVLPVRLHDGRELSARLVDTAPQLGLALFQADDLGATGPLFRPSQELADGAIVLSLGNGFGLRSSVAMGTLSGKNRRIGKLGGLLQISVPVNPGDGGGILADSCGRVVGVLFTSLRGVEHAAARSADGQRLEAAEGVHFAIPIEAVFEAFRGALRSEKIYQDRPRLGASLTCEIPCALRCQLGLKDGVGLMVVDLLPGYPAQVAGLQPYDVLLAVNGEELRGFGQLRQALESTDGRLAFELVRNCEIQEVVVQLPIEKGSTETPK